jgi:hypothetical protein
MRDDVVQFPRDPRSISSRRGKLIQLKPDGGSVFFEVW